MYEFIHCNEMPIVMKVKGKIYHIHLHIELAEIYLLASPENNLKSQKGMNLRSMFAFILPICVEIHKIVTPGGGA